MNMCKVGKQWVSLLLVVLIGVVLAGKIWAQDAAAPAAGAAVTAPAPAAGLVLDKSATADAKAPVDTGFMAVVFGSGFLGVILWLGLLATLISMIYFTIDCSMTVKAKRIIPPSLIQKVTESMSQGDVVKALQTCTEEPSPMANILVAAFGHVEEGFDTIQEAVSVAAEFESERLMQHISWLSVTASLAPMLGLLGTVQGMIMAFAGLATGGATNTGMLALAISQALWTTAAGLCVAIPAITSFTVFRNLANRMALRMQAITMDLIKDLRNVEVVAE
ncbi:MAG: MotA/TolQ/ExbB proton channel family protein [bacterium]